MNKPTLYILALLTTIASCNKFSEEKYSNIYPAKNKVDKTINVQLITQGTDSTIALTNENNILFYTNKRGNIFHPTYRDNLVDVITSVNITNSYGNALGHIFHRTAELEPLFKDIDKDYRKYVNVVKAGINSNNQIALSDEQKRNNQYAR
jgi:hypothetical protein